MQTRADEALGLVAALLVAVAIVTRVPALVVIAAGALVAWVVVRVTGRLALTGMDVEVRLEPDRVVAGEPLAAVVEIVNRKPLPLPWLDVRLSLPEGIEPEKPRSRVARDHVSFGFAPRAHERCVVRFPLRATQRGAFAVGPLRLRGGDWLGFTTEERSIPVGATVVAYPSPLVVADRYLASLRPLAEAATKRGLVPDPLRFRGVRPHRRGDPRKEIHWKSSARLGELQTKLYEPAASLDAIFLVNVASYEQFWIQADPEAVETVVSATASLMRIAADAGRAIGLVTNGIDNLTHERPRSALGRGPRPMQRALEILARLGPYAAASPEQVFLRERGRLPWGATLTIVTPRLGAGLASAAISLRRAGHRVLALSLAPPPEGMAARLLAGGVVLSVLFEEEQGARAAV